LLDSDKYGQLTIIAFMISDKLMTPMSEPGFGSSLPATTISRWTRRILIKLKMDANESVGEQVTTPSKSTDLTLRASAIVKSSAVCAPVLMIRYLSASMLVA
jgi:hypothetical protein